MSIYLNNHTKHTLRNHLNNHDEKRFLRFSFFLSLLSFNFDCIYKYAIDDLEFCVYFPNLFTF